MADQRASMLINDLSKVPNIVGGLGLAIAAAQKAFNLDYVESLERVVGLIQMLLAGKGADGKDLDTEQAQRLAEARPAIADMIKALAPSRYQYTETTLSVRLDLAHTKSVEGWAVQGGLKINAPFVALGDALYLQGAYADGAQMYTGYCAFTGCYTQLNNGFHGQKIYQSFSDATVNPFTGQLQTSQSFSAVASFLHYWTPEWRSAVFGSYGEQDFSRNARLAQGALYNVLNFNGAANFGSNAVGAPGTRFYQLSQALRDTYQFVAGGSIIWSPVRDLDIGIEAFYTQIGVKHGRAIDSDKSPTAYANVAGINNGTFVPRTTTADSVSTFRFRVQRDF